MSPPAGSFGKLSIPIPGTPDRGSVSVANGVVYAGSDAGQMYALEASTGTILWSFESGGTVIDSLLIVDGVLYWGSGYEGSHPEYPTKRYSPLVWAAPRRQAPLQQCTW
jgi:hypothetical protein